MKHLFVYAILSLFIRTAQAEIRIGVIADLSKRTAYLGEQTKRGAEMAVNELRAAGGAVTILVEDHATEPAKAASAAQKLLNVDKVDALYVSASGPAGAVAPLSLTAGKVMVYDSIAGSIRERCSVCFKTFVDVQEACRTIAEHWRASGMKTIALLHTISEFGDLCASGAKVVFPDIIDEEHNIGEELSSQMLRLKAKGAQGILNMAYEGDVFNMLKAADALSFEPRFGIIADNDTRRVRDAYPEAMRNIDAFAAVVQPSSFKDSYRKAYPGASQDSITHAVTAYLHTKQLYKALLACPDRNAVCVSGKLSSAEAVPEAGFDGWNNRSAQFEGRLREQRQP